MPAMIVHGHGAQSLDITVIVSLKEADTEVLNGGFRSCDHTFKRIGTWSFLLPLYTR